MSTVDSRAGLVGLLRARAASAPDAPLLRFDDGPTFTVGEFDARTDAAAARLAAAGVGPGDRVCVQARNTPTFPLLWLAAAKLGAVVVPAHAGYRAADLRHVLDDSGSVLMVADDDLVEACAPVAAEVPTVRAVVRASDLTGPGEDGAPTAAVEDSTLLNLQYTSGTTGEPKACMLTQGYWVRLGAIAAEALGLGAGDVVLTAQPFTYMDPQWCLVMCLHAGVPLVVLPRFSASTFWDSVVQHGVTTFYVVGAMATMLLRQPASDADRAHAVRLVVASGIPPALHAELEGRWGAPWREAFGMTETGVDLVVPAGDAASVGTGDIGVPVSSKRIRVVRPDGTDAEIGEAGELQVSGEPMMLGYWNRREATAQTLVDGWLRTGDLACRGADGRLRIVGRLKDMVRRSGENVSAAEVENVIATHPDVTAAAVIAAPDAVRGEEVAAVVALRAGTRHSALVADAIRDVVRAQLADFKVPRYVVLLDALPMTSSGKVAKAELSADWDRLAVLADDATAPLTDLRYEVRDGVATIELDRPEVLNAIRKQTIAELAAALSASAVDPAVRVVLVTGRGRAFCAGQDLDELADQLAAGDDEAVRADALVALERMQEITRILLAHPRPTVAAINGVAVGAGAELAMACDVRFAASDARIGFVEAARGLFQTNGVTWLLPRIVGLARALELVAAAELVTADRAERIGLVNRAVGPDDLLDTAAAFAARVAANAPVSVSQAVDLVRRAYDHGVEEAMALEVAATARCLATEDVREGTRAFHEGRPPTYQGR